MTRYNNCKELGQRKRVELGRVRSEEQLSCRRCSHTWVTRKWWIPTRHANKISPKLCPRCKSAYWNS